MMAKKSLKKPALNRVFLVVVDDSDEMRAALRYAGLRARKTGGTVALFKVIDKSPLMHSVGIEDIAQAEARQQAEEVTQELAGQVTDWSGRLPVIFIREGKSTQCLLRFIEEEKSLSVLVLATEANDKGPGPLISALINRSIGGLRIPVTIVPGNLSDSQIDAIA